MPLSPTTIIAILIALGLLLTQLTDITEKIAKTPSVFEKKEVVEIKEAVEVKENDASQLPEGEGTYYGGGKFAGAEIYETTISPLGGAKPGVIQNWTVKVRHKIPIKEVIVTVRLDKGFYPVSLKLAGGTALDGVWKGSWEIKDTRNVYYQAKIEAKSETDASETTLTFQPLP